MTSRLSIDHALCRSTRIGPRGSSKFPTAECDQFAKPKVCAEHYPHGHIELGSHRYHDRLELLRRQVGAFRVAHTPRADNRARVLADKLVGLSGPEDRAQQSVRLSKPGLSRRGDTATLRTSDIGSPASIQAAAWRAATHLVPAAVMACQYRLSTRPP